MKKILALILALALLVPAFGGLELTADAASFTTKPFYLINWEPADSSIKNVFDLPQFWVKNSSLDNFVVSWNGRETRGSIAQELKKEFKDRPEGTRYFTYMAPQSVMSKHAEAIVYFDNSIEIVRSWIDKFLAAYKSIKGELDGIVLDFEYLDTSASNITDYYKNTDKQIFQKMQDHPSYQTKLRPMLVEYGFKFYTGSTNSSELYSIHSDSGAEYSTSRAIWNKVMDIWKAQHLSYAVYEPLKKYYPDAHLNDYDVYNTYNWLRTPSDLGTTTDEGGNLKQAGDTGNIYTYAHRPSYWFIRDGREMPKSFNKATMEDNVFDGFLWDMRYIKDVFAAADEGRFSAWVTCYDYHMSHYKVGNGYRLKNIVSGTAYHTETIYHVAMTDPDPMMGYILEDEVKRDIINSGAGTPTAAQVTAEYNKRIKNFSAILDELDRVVGFSDRKPIEYAGSWNSDFVISGMYAGGRNVWRITPDTTKGVSLDQFKVKDKAPTFYINGQTIIFPQGRIIQDTRIEPYGSCGYWVETPEGVEPVVINDADRLSSKNPAYEETFSAKLDTKYWKTTGTTTLKNGELAMSNNSTLKNVTIPKRVTAGDTYAKQQAWEITFTMPNTVNSVQATLLSGGTNDGFQIKDGKLYYSDAGTYKELTSLSAGGKYTIKRELDFATNQCSYYVSGSKSAEIKNVSLGSVTQPVDTITFSAKTAGSEVLLLDNYKLYPTGVAADFYLYDAESGYKLTGSTNDGATAYRLSWMNATNQTKKATVVAEFYNGGSLVSTKTVGEFVMSPGADGVETAIVPLSAGKSVKLSVTVADSAAKTWPNYDNGNFSWVVKNDPPVSDGGNQGTTGGDQGTTGGNQGTTGGNQGTTGGNQGTTGGNQGTTGGNQGTTGGNQGTTDNNQGNIDDPIDDTTGDTTGDTTEDTTGDTTDDTTGNTTDDTVDDTVDDTTGNIIDDPQDTPDPGEKKGLSGAAIAWIVVGSVLVAAGAAVGILFLVKKETAIQWISEAEKRILKK